jgi:hypothetical protein
MIPTFELDAAIIDTQQRRVHLAVRICVIKIGVIKRIHFITPKKIKKIGLILCEHFSYHHMTY